MKTQTAALAAPAPPALAADYAELIKPRITTMVLISTLAGFYMASSTGGFDLWLALHTLIGTGLTAGCANALNMVAEREHDARMERTRNRPLPAGRLSAREPFLFSTVGALLGVLYLMIAVNWVAGYVAGASLALYIFVYTPLKRTTEWNTAIGAVAGAAPPLIGWTAASGALDAAGASLFLILFIWQLPHFFAIAWLYRDDYAAGGYRMLAVADPDGRRMAWRVPVYTLGLIGASLLPFAMGRAGAIYAAAAVALGAGFLAAGLALTRSRSRKAARGVLLASVVYLPLLFGAMVFDKI